MRHILSFLRRFHDGTSRPSGEASAVSAPPTLSKERLSELYQLEKTLGYSFTDLTLLDRALTHRSFVHRPGVSRPEEQTSQDYESLEFLGDSILGFVISEFLFRNYPAHPEGALSRIKSFLVSREQLYLLSQELSLGQFIRLSYGEEKTGGRRKKAILADLFESLIAAIHLDGGVEPARQFILSQFKPHLQEIAREKLDFGDYKSALQEKLHLLGFSEPHYLVVDESGPDHQKQFVVEVRVKDKSLARASGKSKKEAQQHAAEIAIENFDKKFPKH